jgi:hypothetical protein
MSYSVAGEMEGDIFHALRELSRRPEFAEIHRLLGRFLDSQLRVVSLSFRRALTGSDQTALKQVNDTGRRD